jgi:large subunit ribosomal protein L4
LSAKVRDGGLMVIDELGLTEPKTRLVLEMLRQSGGVGGAVSSSLIVTAGREPNVLLSVRNLQGVRAIEARNINVYDVVKHQRVLLTKDALLALEGALAR